MEPYIMNLRHPRGEEMRVELEDPAPHQVFFYNQAIEDLAEDLGYRPDENELIPDGGRPRKYFFAWRDENGEYLSDKTVNGDAADVANESIAEAEAVMERLMDNNPDDIDRYESAALYKIKLVDKKMEGREINTEQKGLSDFAPDGGYLRPEGYDQELAGLGESADQLHW